MTDHDYSVRLIADSVGPSAKRISTYELTYPRWVHAELMTHRLFCLAGDMELEFDLPAGQQKTMRRVHKMTIGEFVNKWLYGARRFGAKPKKRSDVTVLEDEKEYDVAAASALLGLSNPSNLNRMCREGEIAARRHPNGKTWLVTGRALKLWRQGVVIENRFDMKAKLQGMRIRQLNEVTGDIQLSSVVQVYESGVKEVYEVRAGGYTVAGSRNHRVFTTDGWKTIGELTCNDVLIVRRFGKKKSDKKDPLRLKRIEGKWRSKWQSEMRDKLRAQDPKCRRCRKYDAVEVHHIIPVYQDTSRTFDEANITILCECCHDVQHEKQGWQGGTYLYGAEAPVTDIRLRGVEPTYDIEVAGEFANFIANGVVVHNSRNSASSRAISMSRLRSRIEGNPAMPIFYGKQESSMQANEPMPAEDVEKVKRIWRDACRAAMKVHTQLEAFGLHKQWTNRIVEPWMFITITLTATEYDGWFHQRVSALAQPEIAWLSQQMFFLRQESRPIKLHAGEWHLPYITDEDRQEATVQQLVQLSTARCARTSYLTHEGKRSLSEDYALYQRLRSASPAHWSPAEHPCAATTTEEWNSIVLRHIGEAVRQGVCFEPSVMGNVVGWISHRKQFPHSEEGILEPPSTFNKFPFQYTAPEKESL